MLLIVGLLACTQPWTDPALTGIDIRPPQGEQDGPVEVGVRNRTGAALTCEVYVNDACPALDTSPLADLPDGETWSVDAVSCFGADVACWAADDLDALPLRVWTWSILPEDDG